MYCTTHARKGNRLKRYNINEIGAAPMHPIKACLVSIMLRNSQCAYPTIINEFILQFFFFCLSNGQKRGGNLVCQEHVNIRFDVHTSVIWVGLPLPLVILPLPTPHRRQILGQVTPETRPTWET